MQILPYANIDVKKYGRVIRPLLVPESEPSVGSHVRRTQKNTHTLFSQKGEGDHIEILRTYVQIYVGCTKDDVTQSIEKGDLKS
jgi:hypothetical protein